MKTKQTILTIALLGAFISTAQSQGRGDPNLSMGNSNKEVTITLKNPSGSSVQLLWIGFNGKPNVYGEVPAQSQVEQKTFPGHLWMMRNSRGQMVGRYRATQQNKQTYSIGGGNARPTPGRGNPSPRGNPNTPPQPPKPMVKPVTPSTPPSPQPVKPVNTKPVVPVPVPVPKPQQKPATPVGGGGGSINNTGSQITPADAKALVDFHNKARREVGVGNVKWNPQIAAYAQQWANELARTGKFAHRPQNQQRYGENLATGTTGAFTVVRLADGWYKEKPLYKPAGAPFSMNHMPAGHYTQMVWRGSTEIGAGIAHCQTGQLRGMTILVCNYNPRGNMLGQPAF